jgi:Zn-dependent protease/CBS domain-containing protein
MSWSISLFKVRGIAVKVHLTFVLILAWAAYHWGVDLGGGATGALFGIVVTLLLFVCVTLHELAHSFTAMHYGITVRDITLLPIGGLARMEKMPEKPEQELKMSLAGPLTNIVIALLLILILLPFKIHAAVGLGELFSMLGAVSWYGLAAYLVTANLALGIFNLLPAFPMDGGRVLRAFLAMRMDHARATAWAVSIGQGLAWLLGLFGVLSGNWTLTIIAIFVYMGAGQEGRAVEVRNVLQAMQVRQAATTELHSLPPQATLAQAMEIVLKTFQTDFPILENDRLVGLLTESDLFAALQKQDMELPVSRFMHTQFPTARPNESLAAAQERMGETRLRALPVLEQERFIGLLTSEDINQAYRLLTVNPEFAESLG